MSSVARVGAIGDININININIGDINDDQVTTEAQLGLIGGTMGLLTGFSILSGVEIVYYLIRFFRLFSSDC